MAKEDTNSLRLYLDEISSERFRERYPLLSPEKERDLAIRIQQGDESAKETMVNSNLLLVVRIVNRYIKDNNSHNKSDLIQEGNEVLMRCAEKFDLERNCRFSTYAGKALDRTIERAIEDNKLDESSMRVANKRNQFIGRYNSFRERFYVTHGRFPDKAESAEEFLVSKKKIEELESQDRLKETIYLDDSTDQSAIFWRPETIEDKIDREQVIGFVNDGRRKLTDWRKPIILRLRNGLDGSTKQTAKETAEILANYGKRVTGSRVRQLQREAETELRLIMLEDYPDFITDVFPDTEVVNQ